MGKETKIILIGKLAKEDEDSVTYNITEMQEVEEKEDGKKTNR